MQGEVLGTSTQVGYVTQDELTAEINDLRALIYQLAPSTTTALTNPQIAANGNGVYFGEAAAPVTQLSASTLTGLTAAEIPDLSGTYLPLTGGSLTGALYVPTLSASSTSYNVFAANDASTTLLSNFGTAYFGGTATTTIDSAGNVVLPATAKLTAPYASSTALTVSGTGYFAALGGTAFSSLSTNYLPKWNGGTWVNSLLYDSSSALGIGTTSPFATLSIAGTAGGTQNLFAISTSTVGFATSTALRISSNGNLHFLNGAGIDIGNGITPPGNGLIVAGNVGIGTTTPSFSLSVAGNVSIGNISNSVADGAASKYALDVVNNTSPFLARFASENVTSVQYPFLVVDQYHNGFGGGPQISMRNWAGNTSSPGGVLPSGTLLGEYLWEGPTTADGTIWSQWAGIEAYSDEASSPTNTGTHIGFYVNDLGGSVNGNSSVERMRIAPNGIGIRTGAPAYQLDVKGFGRISTTTFTGSGLNDLTPSGTWTGTDVSTDTYTIIIDSTGTPDTFEWQKNGGAFTTGVAITGAVQIPTDGVRIKFTSTTGHTLGDQWVITVTPVSPFGIQNAAGTRSFVITNAGNVGISTSSPTANAGFSVATTTYFANNVGVGTTKPYARLSVWGSDAASSTLAFNVVNSASTTVFAVFDGGNAQLSGTLTQSSDQRLKTNIQSLDASDTLALIDQLNPVAFNWIDPDQGSGPQVGFIAQDVQKIFPELVSTTSATALTPGGTLGLNYIGLISPIVSAIQALSGEVQSLISEVQGFAQSFTSNTITFNNELCTKKSDGTPICITGDQLAALLATQGSASNASTQGSDSVANQSQSPAQQSPAAGSNPPESVTQTEGATTTPTTPPTITINGDNPAIITVGDSYADLGATVSDMGSGQAGDTNLGLQTFLNGTLVSNIVIDTSQVATDTDGLTATSTRTVLIEATAATPTDQ